MYEVALFGRWVRVVRRGSEERVPALEVRLRIHRAEQLLHGAFETAVDHGHGTVVPPNRDAGVPEVGGQAAEGTRYVLGRHACPDIAESLDRGEPRPTMDLEVLDGRLRHDPRQHDFVTPGGKEFGVERACGGREAVPVSAQEHDAPPAGGVVAQVGQHLRGDGGDELGMKAPEHRVGLGDGDALIAGELVGVQQQRQLWVGPLDVLHSVAPRQSAARTSEAAN